MMSLEREKQMLTELRQLASMDKTDIADAYKVPVDAADIYRQTKTTAVLDTVIDSLDDAIAYYAAEQQQQGKG